jgi:hypothetical protein
MGLPKKFHKHKRGKEMRYYILIELEGMRYYIPLELEDMRYYILLELVVSCCPGKEIE